MDPNMYASPPKGDPFTAQVMSVPGERVVPQVELRVSCKGLPKLDTMSKSDPMCILERKTLDGHWAEAGRTEQIQNDHNPKFVTAFKVDFHFEERQELRFSIYDADSKSAKLSKHDFIGTFYTCLGEIMVSEGQSVTKALKDPSSPSKDRGTITVHGEELAGGNLHVSCQLRAEGLDDKDWFSKTDGYYIVHRSRESGGYAPVYKSEVVKNNLNPTWRPFEMSAADISGGDLDRPLLIEVFDYDWASKDDLVGNAQTSLRSLSEGNAVELKNPKKIGRKKYRNSGVLHPARCQITKMPSFLDYIIGGCEMNLMVAIDFTASNGSPSNPSSLHYRAPDRPNEYQRAIAAVGSILSDYDSDQVFPCYGFGAKLPPNNQVSHAFALNGNPSNPGVHGVDGMLAAYDQAVSNVTLHGPTVFSQIIRLAAAQAAGVSQHQQKYTTLLIITDGEITDMNDTIRAIVDASRLALSIIIVGVGSASFDKMDQLDGDDARLSAGGHYAARDIVQFVPFRRFANMDASYLAKEVLAEVPGQMLSFFRTAGIRPNPPRQISVPAVTGVNPASVAYARSAARTMVQGHRSAAAAAPPPAYAHPHAQQHPLTRMGSSGNVFYQHPQQQQQQQQHPQQQYYHQQQQHPHPAQQHQFQNYAPRY